MQLKVTNEIIELHDGIHSYPCGYDKILPQDIPMVIASQKSLLQEIDLKEMLSNLDNASELLYIAFCALHGKCLQADLDGLQMTLLKLCGQSKITMTTFRDQSKEITLEILRSYKFMKKGMVGPAKIIFESTAEYARSMAEQSKQLANEFNGLANQTGEVLKSVEKEHASEVKNKEEIEAALVEMEAGKIKQQRLAEGIAEDLEVINSEYQEEKEALKTAETREMTMSIVSMITGAVSLGISAFTNAKGGAAEPPTVNTDESKQLEAEKSEKEKQQVKFNKDKENAQKKLETWQADLIDLKNTLRTKKEQVVNKKEICDQEDESDRKERLQKEVIQLETEVTDIEFKISEKQKEIDKTESNLKDYTAELQGLSEGLKAITTSLQKMQERVQNAVEQHAKNASSLLKQKLAMEKEKREALAEMGKFVILIQGNANKVITTETAIRMLIITIQCLKRVVSSLITAAMFWESLQKYCEKLSKTSIVKLLDSVENYSKEERIEFFMDEDFVLAIITYASQWAAMYYVSDEYYQAASKTYKKTENNFNSMLKPKEALVIAQKRSTDMLKQVTQQEEASQKESEKIESQLKNLVMA